MFGLIYNLIQIEMSGKKKELNEQADNSQESYEIDEDLSDEEIEDDG